MKAIILRAAALTAATSTLLSAAGPEATARPRGDGPDGAPGLGDRYFPRSGNGGYDVRHYDVTMAFTPRGGRVAATVAVTARALQDLRAFDLDFRGPTVESITVGGRPAGFRRSGQELIVTPETALAAGTTFTTVVRYSGTPRRMHNRDLGSYGWVRSRDGALALGEPDGAQTWLPSNDHPRDKATYDVRVTVPNGLQVIGNGVPDPPERGARTTTYTWHERRPMASYLATVAIGRFRILTGRAGAIPVLTAVDPKYARHARRVQATTIKAIRLESRLFGPYPFASAGAIIDDPKVGYALETQERPVYAGLVPDESFIVHEIAHQWFGDSVGLTRWRDIWLNEGLATYAEWLWDEKVRHRPARVRFRRYYMQPARSAIFSPPPGRPGARRMFAFSVYLRGAMTLQALRNRVGDRAFFRTLRHWASEHRYGHGTTAQFIALAKREARGRVPARRIDRLFRAWLYRKGKPTSW